MQRASQRVGATLDAVLVFLLFWGVASEAPRALAQSPNTFTATGSMSTPRLGHTATLLTNGKVLIAGGARDISPDGNYLPVASVAEVYDPSIGTFTRIGNLDDGDDWASTTLLVDGRVLIVGFNAHLYDPGNGNLSDPIFDNYLGIYF